MRGARTPGIGAIGLALAIAVLGCGAPRERAARPPEAAPAAQRAETAQPAQPAQQARQAPAPAAAKHRRRGLWVLCEGSQRVLEHPELIPTLMADARALGVDDLFVQVYRGGRAWFPSTLADTTPWKRVSPPGGPDALAALLDAAHRQGLRVHAWVNVLSLSSNADAPLLSALGRGAAVVDQRGRSILDYPGYEVPQPDRGWYRMGTPAIWLDPAAPGVADRLAATFAELLALYPFDGLHLDYIRYADALPFSPGTRFGVGLFFGFGQASRARFTAETGLTAPFRDSLTNATAFDDWRRQQLTKLVARIAARARATRPGVQMSAAVIADAQRAYLVDLQDWLGWLDAGLLDFAAPMQYTQDPRIWRYGVETLAGLARGRDLRVGLGAWLFGDEPAGAVAQLQRLEAEPRLGSSLFSWDSLRTEPALRAALAAEVARAGSPPAR